MLAASLVFLLVCAIMPAGHANTLETMISETNGNSVENFINVNKEKLNTQVEAIADEAKRLMNQSVFVAHLQELTNNVVDIFKPLTDQGVLTKLYRKLDVLGARSSSINNLVEAFMVAITLDLNHWMYQVMFLPHMELDYKLKYICATKGYLSNMKTLLLGENDWSQFYDTDLTEDTTEVKINFVYKSLHVTYDRFHENTFLTKHVDGNLDMDFDDGNEVEFTFQIPRLDYDRIQNRQLKEECLVSIKQFKVIRLSDPKITIWPASAFRTFAQNLVAAVAKVRNDKIRMLVELGVVQAMSLKLKESPRNATQWLCQTEELNNWLSELIESHKNSLAPVNMDSFLEYCPEETPQDPEKQSGPE